MTGSIHKRIRPHKVLAVVALENGISAREILSGIFKFINAGHLWALRLVQSSNEFTSSVIDTAAEQGFDGIIATISGAPGSTAALAKVNLPVVLVDIRDRLLERRKKNIAFVWNDNLRIGALGAKYLAGLGKFKSFSFVPATENRLWSSQREKAFVRELNRRRLPCSVFGGGSADTMEDMTNLAAWLRKLPKPAAVMAAWDYRATQVLEACCEYGINVPDDVAILGVDNDELLCCSSSPSLSSVFPDHVDEGFRAAQSLERMMSAKGSPTRSTTCCRVKGVVERESTCAVSPSDTILQRAEEFIARNAKSNLKVKDVVSHVRSSRRLLELRFREKRKTSILAAITERRIAEVKKLLSSTKRSVSQIAAECGFKSASHLSHLFTRTVGRSPREYRSIGKAAVPSFPARQR